MPKVSPGMAETEKLPLQTRLDNWGRRHPRLVLLLTILLAALATPFIIGATQAAVVLYKDF
jgi:hypothetical protein